MPALGSNQLDIIIIIIIIIIVLVLPMVAGGMALAAPQHHTQIRQWVAAVAFTKVALAQ